MAEVKFPKGSEEWQMFMDYWGLCQKYWKPEPADEYWEALIVEMDVFYKKYGTDFAKALALSLICELERKDREVSRIEGV